MPIVYKEYLQFDTILQVKGCNSTTGFCVPKVTEFDFLRIDEFRILQALLTATMVIIGYYGSYERDSSRVRVKELRFSYILTKV